MNLIPSCLISSPVTEMSIFVPSGMKRLMIGMLALNSSVLELIHFSEYLPDDSCLPLRQTIEISH